MIIVESAGLTDVGQRRKGNEDDLFMDDDLGLYVVADGMGGHQAGEVASRIVVDTIQTYMQRFKHGGYVEELADSDATLSKEANRLLSSIHLANSAVFEVSISRPACRGMGSTVAAVYFTPRTVVVANVGDSPIYLAHDGVIEEISVPHTVAEEQRSLDLGQDGPVGEAFKHMLTRGMGIRDSVQADLSEIQCFDDNVLVVCSDGLSNKVEPDEILAIVNLEQPPKACRLLVDLANERGGEDNITVVVLKLRRATGIHKMLRRMTRGLKTIFSRRQ